MLNWFKSLFARKSHKESRTVGVAHSHIVLSQGGGIQASTTVEYATPSPRSRMWEGRQLDRFGGDATAFDMKGNPELRQRLQAAISGTPFIYDEHQYAGGMPTPEAARLLLEDLENGLAIPHAIIEPGWKERLESIAAGLPVDPSFWQR